jgi:hypothetical protein
MAATNHFRVVVAVLALALVVATSSPPAEAATDVLPDLGMAPLDNLQIENTQDGRRLLRFDAIIVNVGPGAFELRGERDSAAAEMNVTQHIFDSAGGQRDRPTTATMFYAGDGHSHWHVKDLAQYSLLKKQHKKHKRVRTDAKQGFCFFDNYWFGSTQAAHYTGGCANNQPGALEVTMGLSRGWGDIYRASTVGQYVDITGLPDGRYRLKAKADSGSWFKEQKEKNNFTWVDIQISGTSVSVIRYGPAATPI